MQYGSIIPLYGSNHLHIWPECCILCHIRTLRPVLHSRRSGHTAPVPCPHSFHHGFTKLMIHATYTDVVVLATAVSNVLQDCEIWVAFGHGSKLRFIPCHLIATKLGNDGSRGIPLNALSGCDTVSAFHGIGKKTAWAVWCSMPHLATVFSWLARAPSQVFHYDLNEIERYVVLLYQRTSAPSHVNEARKQLFAQNRTMENIPPTLHALEQHVKRDVYQAGHSHSMESQTFHRQIHGIGRE